MLVNEHTILNSTEIAGRAAAIYGRRITGGRTGGILRGMINAGLVTRRLRFPDDHGKPESEYSGRVLTDAGRYAAEIMRGLMEDGGGNG
jgi:hypothetical protein